jgi:hypothetical protein
VVSENTSFDAYLFVDDGASVGEGGGRVPQELFADVLVERAGYEGGAIDPGIRAARAVLFGEEAVHEGLQLLSWLLPQGEKMTAIFDARNSDGEVSAEVGAEVLEGCYGAGRKGVVPVCGRVGEGRAKGQAQDGIAYPSVRHLLFVVADVRLWIGLSVVLFQL